MLTAILTLGGDAYAASIFRKTQELSLLSALVRPSSREHVLGDLAECAHTRGQYLAAFVAVLPTVVLSQVRRTVRAHNGLSLTAAFTIVALGRAAVVTRGPPGTRLWNGKGVLAPWPRRSRWPRCIARGRLVPGLLALAVTAIVSYGVGTAEPVGARWLDDALAETRALEGKTQTSA